MTASEVYTVPARRGRALRLRKDEAIKIINTHGSQVFDTWAFNADDLTEFLSNEHMRATIKKLWPGKSDQLVTNRRRSILIIEEDISPGCGMTHLLLPVMARLKSKKMFKLTVVIRNVRIDCNEITDYC